jgi:hypothetical protein
MMKQPTPRMVPGKPIPNIIEISRRDLNEIRIKCLLLDHIEANYNPQAIGVEVPFMAGQRWADVLLITGNKELIAFEIKSDRDSFRRLEEQLADYTNTFNQVYLILSRKFIGSKILRRLPASVGYAFIDAQRKKLIFERRAQKRTRLSKDNLMFFLWKRDLGRFQLKPSDSVELLRERMKRSMPLSTIKKRATDALLGRYRKRYLAFRREKSIHVHAEDLNCLTKTFWGSI